MHRILITGGSGFLGGAVAAHLARQNNVVVYDLAQSTSEAGSRMEFVQGDIRDPKRLSAAIAGCDTVFHFAGQLGVQACQQDEALVRDVNTGGAVVLAKLITETKTVKRAVVMSSSEVYGEGNGHEFEETGQLKPITAYGRSKVEIENIFRAIAGERERQVVVIRPFNIYGPRQRSDFVISNFCSIALTTGPITVYGSGQQTRTFTYIDDFVNGALGAYAHSFTNNMPFEIFNIASRETVMIKTLAQIVQLASGRQVPIETKAFGAPDVQRDAD